MKTAKIVVSLALVPISQHSTRKKVHIIAPITERNTRTRAFCGSLTENEISTYYRRELEVEGQYTRFCAVCYGKYMAYCRKHGYNPERFEPQSSPDNPYYCIGVE